MSVCGARNINKDLDSQTKSTQSGHEYIFFRINLLGAGLYSVKRVSLNLPPFGAIKRGDAELLICQKLLRNVAVEDFFQPGSSGNGGVVYTQKPYRINRTR